MSQIIDVRSNGGELVILGRLLALPNAVDVPFVDGTEPPLGSLRYNPAIGRIQMYVPGPGGGEWTSTGTTGDFLSRDGDTVFGDLVFTPTARLRLAAGSVMEPALTFNDFRQTGFSTVAGALNISSNGVRVASFANTLITFDRTVGHLHSLTARIHELTVRDEIVIEENTSDPDPVLFMRNTQTGKEWSIYHNTLGALVQAYEGNAVSVLRTDGTLVVPFVQAQVISPGADLAERYHADAPYAPGTVLVIGGKHEVTISRRAHDPRIAGIVSTLPGVRMNDLAGSDDTHPYVALKGRVPCLVTGRISKGDVLVTSDKPGHAMAASPYVPAAEIVGRALADFSGTTGTIEVMVF